MMDFLGRNVEPGDFVVFLAPYSRGLALGRIKKINTTTVTVLYVPEYWMSDDSPEFRQKFVEALCSDDFDSKDKIISFTDKYGRYTEEDFTFVSRDRLSIVKVEKEDIGNYLDSRL